MENLMNDFRKSHNNYKFITVVTIGACVLISLGCLFFAKSTLNKCLNSIWVAVDGKVYKSEHHNDSFNYIGREIEYEQLAREYHKLRYSGDRYSYSDNFNRCLNYVHADFQEQMYNDYQDEKMEREIKEKDVIFNSYTDSVRMVTKNEGVLYGRQYIRTRSRNILRNLYFTFRVTDLESRSDKNHLGAVLTDIEIFNNEVLQKR